ncbi:SCO family protein [Mesorhizobium koreense]|jgi:protein SCO1/2|uniref:SCO family protein n=1 Tax=Mesorhizobium koreense TaxID=3074855 RepID=UPI00287BB93D|nr:SCO family protein [Mesorhizobium sp. WR6]
MRAVFLLVAFLFAATPASAIDRPTFNPTIGARLDLTRVLREASGVEAPLSSILGGRPALVVFGYDKCPNLCGVTQRAVASELRKTGLDPEAYRALFISIDKTETRDDAAEARAGVAEVTDAKGLSAWRFLTSGKGDGAVLAAEAGIDFRARPRIDQFVHPIAVLALTPQGRIAQVLPALQFEARDLRLALVQASAGKLGSLGDHIFLLCAGFDASKGQYTPTIKVVLRIGGIVTMALLLGAIGAMTWRRRA